MGPSRNVSRLSCRGAGVVVYLFKGITVVVKVLPSLVIRTCPASRSTLLGRANVNFIGVACLVDLPPMVIATTNWP